MNPSEDLTRSSNYRTTSSFDKYHGLIQVSFFKQVRNALFSLLSYIYSVASPFYGVHTFISYWRVLQILLASSCADYPYWEKDTFQYKLVDFFNIFAFFVPLEFHDKVANVFLIVYNIIFYIFFFLILIFAYLYQTNAKLPSVVPNLVVLFNGIINYIGHPPAILLMAEIFGKLCAGEEMENKVLSIVLASLTFLTVSIALISVRTFIACSVLFRPTSLATIDGEAQNNTVGFMNLIILCIGIGSKLNKAGQLGLIGTVSFFYMGLFLQTLLGGGFISMDEQCILMTSSLTGFIISLTILTKIALGLHGSSVEIAIYIVINIIAYYLARLIVEKMRNSHIIALDFFLDDKESFNNIRTIGKFTNICLTGFSEAHPACLDWSIFKEAAEKWPTNIHTWYVYAKFAAIYPEETFILLGIKKSIEQVELKGSFAKSTVNEIETILRMREGSLSLPLKDRLNIISRDINTAKHKLIHVWDMAIQGNINEMEKAIVTSYNSVNKCNTQFNHLLRSYQNNRFITRAYARFLIEVCADSIGFTKYEEYSKILQRGGKATSDTAHILGIHAFPALPSVLHRTASTTLGSDDGISQSSMDTDSNINEENASISKTFDEVVFPATKYGSIIRVLFPLFVFALPLSIFAYLSHVYTDNFAIPLEYIMSLSTINTLIHSSNSFMLYAILANEGKIPNPTVIGMGGKMTIAEQMEAVIQDLIDILEKLNGLQSYMPHMEHAKCAIDYIFVNRYSFNKTAAGGLKETKNITVTAMIMDYAVALRSIVMDTNHYTIDSPEIVTARENTDFVSSLIEKAIDEINLNIEAERQHLMFNLKTGASSFIVGFSTIWIAMFSIVIYKISKEKEELLRCFTSLQKNVVSAITDKLKVIGKSERTFESSSDSDINKQEENLIKVFSTASDASALNTSKETINIISGILVDVYYIITLILQYFLMKKSCQELTETGSQINYVMGSFGYKYGVSSDILYLYGKQGVTPALNFSATVKHMQEMQNMSINYLNNARYGNKTEGISPYSTLIEDYLRQKNSGRLPPETAFIAVDTFANSISQIYNVTNNIAIGTSDIIQIWDIMNFDLYYNFYNEIFDTMIKKVRISIQNNVMPLSIGVIAVCILICISEVFVFYVNRELNNTMMFALKLLLHCPPHIIQQSSRIMAIVAGNFNQQKNDKTTRGSDYYFDLVQNMPDSIIVISKDVVDIMNNSAMRLLGIKTYEKIPLSCYIDNENAKFLEEFNKTTETAPNYAAFKSGDVNFVLEISLVNIKEYSIYTIRDKTQYNRYNTLIQEERTKSDLLLASILPPKLVSRVQEGEKDISFEVQSASVMFMDIVEFTPWCASVASDTVMSTLNKLFTEFDLLVNKSSTLTRIKCIGDCYMAAGGIFAEINQPDVHAKEAVQFGLDSIKTVEKINEEIGQHLQIRVGVNTGGPLIAGVIGTGKPTFEIIGPVINIAQQMEHFGVPMNVHISRAVYELIYGGSFNIKERGQIEIKSGTAVTYLVSNQ